MVGPHNGPTRSEVLPAYTDSLQVSTNSAYYNFDRRYSSGLRVRVIYAAQGRTYLLNVLLNPVVVAVDAVSPYIAFLWYKLATLQITTCVTVSAVRTLNELDNKTRLLAYNEIERHLDAAKRKGDRAELSPVQAFQNCRRFNHLFNVVEVKKKTRCELQLPVGITNC